MSDLATANQAWAQVRENLAGIGQAGVRTAALNAELQQQLMLERERIKRQRANELLVQILADESLDKNTRMQAMFEIPRIWDTPAGEAMIKAGLQEMFTPEWEQAYRQSQTAENFARADYWSNRPEGPNLQTVTGAEDVYTFNPTTGEYRPSGIGVKKPPTISQQEWETQLLSPDEQRQRALIKAGIQPRARDVYLRGANGLYYRVEDQTAMPVEGMPTQQAKPIYKMGLDGVLYLIQDGVATPVEGMTGDKQTLEQMKTIAATMKSLLDPFGEVVPGNEQRYQMLGEMMTELLIGAHQQIGPQTQQAAPQAAPGPAGPTIPPTAGAVTGKQATPQARQIEGTVPSVGTQAFEKEMYSLPPETRIATIEVAKSFIDDAIRRMPDAGREEIIAEAKRMAKLHGWIIE